MLKNKDLLPIKNRKFSYDILSVLNAFPRNEKVTYGKTFKYLELILAIKNKIIARDSKISHNTVSETLKDLESEKYIKKEKRAYRITKKGINFLNGSRTIIEKEISFFLYLFALRTLPYEFIVKLEPKMIFNSINQHLNDFIMDLKTQILFYKIIDIREIISLIGFIELLNKSKDNKPKAEDVSRFYSSREEIIHNLNNLKDLEIIQEKHEYGETFYNFTELGNRLLVLFDNFKIINIENDFNHSIKYADIKDIMEEIS